ncbi:MAG TPA: methyltransferase domain-containing protein [Ktedonobacterales bacterium]|jgi:SAM-dependent methyltransferase
MSVEQELFIDIDRQPEREQPRPADVPVKKSISRLWPPPTDNLASAAPSSGRVGNLAMLPTMPLAPDLVESLAALAPPSTTSRPLSLAEALAAMQTSTLTPTRPLEPAPPESSAAEAPLAVPESPAGRRTTDGLVHIRVPDAEPLPPPEQISPTEAPDDEYLARVYDVTRPAVAELYERTVVPLWSTPFGRMLLSVFQGHACQPGWQVLDVGCGTGYPTLDLARLLGPDVDVAGMDVWSAGIEHARARASEARLNNVAFLVADVAACDLPEHSFDAAICNLGLTSFAQPDAALKGIARLLQPNGTLVLATSLRGTMQEFFETYRAVLEDLGLLDLSWDVERLMHLQPTLERVEGLLAMAGFTIDQTLSDHVALEFPDGSTFLRSPMVGMKFLPTWRSVIADLSLRRVVFNEIERRLNARAAALGRLDLMAPMLCVTARRRAQE